MENVQMQGIRNPVSKNDDTVVRDKGRMLQRPGRLFHRTGSLSEGVPIGISFSR